MSWYLHVVPSVIFGGEECEQRGSTAGRREATGHAGSVS